MKHLLLVLLVVACTHQISQREPIPEIKLPPIAVTPTKIRETPLYVISGMPTEEYKSAVGLIKVYGNSDEFWTFVAKERTGTKGYFAHCPLSVGEAIKKFRESLDQADTIEIKFYTPWYPSRAIGGWDGNTILENTKMSWTPGKRAGHLLHETAHKYGFVHSGNKALENDNQNSFPYVVGYAFESFLFSKTQMAAR